VTQAFLPVLTHPILPILPAPAARFHPESGGFFMLIPEIHPWKTRRRPAAKKLLHFVNNALCQKTADI